MAGYGFGEELAAARHQNGLSISEVSETLRIRPDIIRAIEAESFTRMPAKGFARNQVSAYARYLGLDPAEYTRRFIKAYNEYERDAAGADYLTDSQQPINDRGYSAARKAQRTNEQQNHSRGHSNNGRSGQRSRSHNDGGRGERPRESTAIRRANDATRESDKARYAAPRRGGRGRRSGDSNIGSKGFNPGGGGLPIKKIAIGIIALIVIVVIAFSVSHCSKKDATDATATPTAEQSSTDNAVQVTGGTASDSAVMGDVSSNALTAMPDIKSLTSSIAIKVSVADGSSSWIQIDTDDSTPVAEDASGPKDYNEVATESAVITIGNASAVTVLINGTEANIEVDDNGLGYVYVKIKDGKLVFGNDAKPKDSSSNSNSEYSNDYSDYSADELEMLDEDHDGYNDFTGEPM